MVFLADSDEETYCRQVMLKKDLELAYYVHCFCSRDLG